MESVGRLPVRAAPNFDLGYVLRRLWAHARATVRVAEYYCKGGRLCKNMTGFGEARCDKRAGGTKTAQRRLPPYSNSEDHAPNRVCVQDFLK